MGLTSTHLKYIINRTKKYKFSGPVLTLGNQDIYATEQEIIKWARESNTKIKIPKKTRMLKKIGSPS